MTSLPDLEGHEGARTAAVRAFLADRLPQTLLLHGPPGIGKQRFALWLGQLILCQSPSNVGPCGACRDCRMALGIQHPDLHWYFPVKKPSARGSRERDQEALEETRLGLLEQIRAEPLRPTYSDEVRGLHLGTIRNLMREASRRPAMAPRRLFIVAGAEDLVAQESAQEAANALLKTLEEPPPDTWYVLTSSEPGRLLPTIRSRATAMHLAPLPRERVRAFVERERGGSAESLDLAAALSGGAIGQALGYLPDGDEEGPLEGVRKAALGLLHAALSRKDSDRFVQALSVTPWGARGLHDLFESLESWIRDLAAVATARDTPILNEDFRDWIEAAVTKRSIHPDRAARSITTVERTRSLAAGNVNPQLLVGRLLMTLHADLVGDHQ